MLVKGSRRYNLRHNTERAEQPEFGKMINGQALGAVSQFRYGICRMSFNGCEVIAVHNTLVYLKKPRPLKDIAFYMERFRVLLGFFGCNAYRLGKALSHFGAEYVKSRNTDGADAFIVTFWTKLPFLSSVHTVFCVRESGGVRVYNSTNGCAVSRLYGSLEDYIGRFKPIAVYTIKTQNDS